MLTWSMQDANIDAKEAAKKVDVSLQARVELWEDARDRERGGALLLERVFSGEGQPRVDSRPLA